MVADIAASGQGGSIAVVDTSFVDHHDRPRLACVSADATGTTREQSLRALVWRLGAPPVSNGSATRHHRTRSGARVVVRPLIVARQSLLADMLAVGVPRSALAATALRRARRKVATWLLDSPRARVSDSNDVLQRFLAAGVPAHSVDLVSDIDIATTHDATWLRERAAALWDLPTERTWVLHLCTIASRRDAVAVAALLRRELRYAGCRARPLAVVVGMGTDLPILRRLVSRHGFQNDVVLLGDVSDTGWLIAAADAIVLLDERASPRHADATTARSRPAFGPYRVVPRLRRRTLILGSGERAQELAAILSHRRSANEVVGFLSDSRTNVGRSLEGGPVVGTFDDLFQVVENEQVQSIVVARDDRNHELPMETLFDLKTMGLEIVDGMKLLEQVSGRIHIEAIRPIQVVFSEGFRRPRAVVALKRCSDAVVSAIGLVALAPIFALLAVLIRLDSRGPTFYRQIRIGLNGKPFSIWKFRSMRADAELLHTPVWATADDPRITRVGRQLRTWRLDELPQLINVARGQMSLVGPRPERPDFVQDLRDAIPFYDLRHTVRPGITGWAQVRFRYAASKDESYKKLQYDLYYVKHMSLGLDLRIAAETLRVMTRGAGAR